MIQVHGGSSPTIKPALFSLIIGVGLHFILLSFFFCGAGDLYVAYFICGMCLLRVYIIIDSYLSI